MDIHYQVFQFAIELLNGKLIVDYVLGGLKDNLKMIFRIGGNMISRNYHIFIILY